MDGNPVGREGDRNVELSDEPPLDVSELDAVSLKERLAGLFWQPWVFRLLRNVHPVARLGGLVFVTRYDDVRTLLEQDQVFHVEGESIRAANRGLGFVLGMQDDRGCPFQRLRGQTPLTADGYRNYQSWVMQHFVLEDLPRLRQLMREQAEQAVGQRRYIDAANDLITHVAIAVCREYYGVDVPRAQEDDFANCTFAISRWMFDPLPASRFRALGERASGRVNLWIERSIDRAPHDARDTVIRRLLAAGVPRDQLRVIIFGMINGFVPTSTMAAGHILQMLLKMPEAIAAARAAVRAEDDTKLERCLFEAMRFKPLLREPLRLCTKPFNFSEDTHKPRAVAAGERVIALTSSAMMDERVIARPKDFDPERPGHHSLLLGSGLHRCVGAPIAIVHAVEALKPLLRSRGLRQLERNGGMKETCGPFPKHMLVEIAR
jgi:cytochrome P450